MKPASYYVIITLTWSCILLSIYAFSTYKTTYQWTKQEKEQAKKEITAQIDRLIKGAKELNLETALKPYDKSEAFMIINPDASYSNYTGMKAANAEAFTQLTSFEFTTLDEDFRFISANHVLYTWVGRNKLTLTSGKTYTYQSYIGTMLFKRINKEWKIVYAHESASNPIVN